MIERCEWLDGWMDICIAKELVYSRYMKTASAYPIRINACVGVCTHTRVLLYTNSEDEGICSRICMGK